MSFIRKFVSEASEPIFALFLGLLIASFLMIAFGYNPYVAYSWLFYGGFGNLTSFLDTLSYAMPLMLTGITFAIGVKAGLFNIGAEGQVYMGALGAIIAGGLLPRVVNVPSFLLPILVILTSALMGLIWSLGPALLKIYRGVHEVISTIMFNWIAYYLAMYLATSKPLVDPARSEKTLSLVEGARFPVMHSKSILTYGVFVSIVFCIGVYLFLKLTKAGFELKIVGANPDAARYAGISQKKAILNSFLIGGLAAGLAGGLIISGRPPVYALYGTLGNVSGSGFDGIGVALIGKNSPLGVILASIFIGGLNNGSRFMEPYAGVASELSKAVNGLIILALAVPELRNYLVKAFKRVR